MKIEKCEHGKATCVHMGESESHFSGKFWLGHPKHMGFIWKINFYLFLRTFFKNKIENNFLLFSR
jgi:hypothetical protein